MEQTEKRNRCFVMLTTAQNRLDNSLFAADRRCQRYTKRRQFFTITIQKVHFVPSDPFNAEGTTNPFRGSPFCYQFEVELLRETDKERTS